MQRLAVVVLLLVACKSGGGGGSEADEPTFRPITSTAQMAGEDEPKPSYDKAALQSALIGERGAEASAERQLGELEAAGDTDKLRVAIDDLGVRRRFIQTLEHCEQSGRFCPPRLDDPAWSYSIDGNDDPKLETPLRFDLDSWRKVSAELHGRACACRTIACIDTLGVAIDRLETRPMEDVQDDDLASLSVTRARECLFRLRGRREMPRLAAE